MFSEGRPSQGDTCLLDDAGRPPAVSKPFRPTTGQPAGQTPVPLLWWLQAHLVLVAVGQTTHDLLQEAARLRLTQALALSHIVQQGTPLQQQGHDVKEAYFRQQARVLLRQTYDKACSRMHGNDFANNCSILLEIIVLCSPLALRCRSDVS